LNTSHTSGRNKFFPHLQATADIRVAHKEPCEGMLMTVMPWVWAVKLCLKNCLAIV